MQSVRNPLSKAFAKPLPTLSPTDTCSREKGSRSILLRLLVVLISDRYAVRVSNRQSRTGYSQFLRTWPGAAFDQRGISECDVAGAASKHFPVLWLRRHSRPECISCDFRQVEKPATRQHWPRYTHGTLAAPWVGTPFVLEFLRKTDRADLSAAAVIDALEQVCERQDGLKSEFAPGHAAKTRAEVLRSYGSQSTRETTHSYGTLASPNTPRIGLRASS